MELYLKAAGAALVSLVVILVISKEQKDIGLLLGMLVCSMILLVTLSYLEPVIDFLERLQEKAQLDAGLLKVLLKAVVIGFLTEIAALICTDSGNSSLGKTVQLLGSAVILWISIPLFESILDLIQRILGDI